MTDRIELTGHCYCGEVRFAISTAATDRPIFTAYCHCDSCRRAHAAPLYQIAAIDKESFSITQGAERVNEFQKGTNAPTRAFTTCCGSRIYNTFGAWRPRGRTPLGFFPSLLDEAAQKDLPAMFRPARMNRPEECVLDAEFLKTLPQLA